MYFRETLLVAALAAVPVLATESSVNVYFGQHGEADIGDVCADPSFEYITLAFINVSPENGGLSGLPGSNFAGHCWAGNYENNGYVSDLLNDCPYLTPGIEVCQTEHGKKVLLSIGGDFTETSNYSISSYENGVEFANFVWGAYGPYDESWGSQPRPFDYGDVHVAVDGYDFDIESADAGDEGYRGMIETLRSLIEASGRDDIITGAPQCPLNEEYQNMLYLLENVQFDRLWIQFYNNPQCEILNTDGSLNSGFNYGAWETFLADTPSANAKLHIGLPASASASSTGYVDATIAANTLCSIQSSKTTSMFGGLMLWDQTFAAANADEYGISYNEALYNSLECSCGECPVSSSTSSAISSTSSSSASSSYSVAPTTVSSPSSSSYSTSIDSSSSSTVSSTTLGPSGPGSQSSSLTTTVGPSGITYTHVTSSIPSSSGTPPSSESLTVSGSAEPTGSFSSTLVGPSGPSTVSTSSEFTSQTASVSGSSSSAISTVSPPAVSVPVSSTQDSSSAIISTRPHSWGNTTWTSHASQASSTDATYTSLPSSSSVGVVPTSSADGGAGTPGSGATSSSSTLPAGVTSTIWTTTVHTVTSCAATVTNCPAGTHYSTSSWVLTTTVVPGASSTSLVGAEQGSTSSVDVTAVFPTTSPAAISPTTTSIAGESTSTIWSTEVHTITSCAPTVTDCPAGTYYSTTSFPVTTTVLPGSHTSKVDVQSEAPSSSSEQWTTSTVYSTNIYTVTSCAATITDCPARIGSVTTEIVAITTTVCPVTAAGVTSTASLSPAETGTTGSVSAGSSGNGSGSESSPSSSNDSGSAGSASSSSGSSPELVVSSPGGTVTSGTLTTTTHVFSTVYVVVPASSSSISAEAAVATEVAINVAVPAASYTAVPSGSLGAGYHNATLTKTYSLSHVGPTTSAVVSESIAPSKSTSATSPIVTAGAGRNVRGVGLAMLVVIAALVL